MAYKLTVAMLAVKDQYGTINQHMAQPVGTLLGPIIPWLSDEDAAHLIAKGLVEEIGPDHPLWEQAQSISIPGGMGAPRAIRYHGEGFDEDRQVKAGPDGTAAPSTLVSECVAKLDQLGVESQASNQTARDALRGAKISFGNEVIAAAVRYRKGRQA
ncbi:hypothetical protein BHQ21_09645 [Mycobacterium sherrisii]|uniref:Uncharacterized protein n=1 Tax=Mycobacterium sherrisii TaxID=243061 RepID=A0A1E3SYR4_9MYCO|nr:hypothetical protein [Mycobacterium sherrisii]ODR07306.1 hypothetical protein BHQ21_09645 [Mycobacterium sherrisii]